MLIPIDGNPMTVEFYEARGSVFEIAGRLHAELPARCPYLSKVGNCMTYAQRPIACSRFIVGSLMCQAAIERRRPNQSEAIKALF
jgi:Fe-S-cluster containining protein